MTDTIPIKEIKDGLKLTLKVVDRLLDSAESFLAVGKYSTSIPLSILALEEIAKVDLLRSALDENHEITKKEWREVTSGRKAHNIKLNWFLDKKEKSVLRKWSEADLQGLNAVNKKLGIPIYYKNKEQIKAEIDLIKDLIPKFKLLKEDCFYINWDFTNNKWIYFDKRFNENIKNLLANYFYAEGRKEYFMQKLRGEMPDKMFDQYTAEEWAKLAKSQNRIELIKIQERLIKIRRNSQLIINALTAYHTSPDENLQVKDPTQT